MLVDKGIYFCRMLRYVEAEKWVSMALNILQFYPVMVNPLNQLAFALINNLGRIRH